MEIKIEGAIDVNAVKKFADDVVKMYKPGDDVNVIIDSLGGYIECAEAIVDILQTMRDAGSRLIAINAGNVMSSATIPWLVCDDRIWYVNRGEYLIHNPYLTGVEGDADVMLECAVQLAEMESQLADIYAMYSPVTKEKVLSIMKENRPLTTDELKELRLATEIIE